jgi:putative Holliday junction resolvase
MTIVNIGHKTTMITSSLQEFYKALKPNAPIIGIDYGNKKIGIAISDPGRIMALPLEVMVLEKENAKLDYLERLVVKYKAGGVVLGLPTYLDGTASTQTNIVNNFAKKLSKIVLVPILLQDERLSSSAAQSLLRDSGMNRKKRDQIDDKIAASLILGAVIDELPKLLIKR